MTNGQTIFIIFYFASVVPAFMLVMWLGYVRRDLDFIFHGGSYTDWFFTSAQVALAWPLMLIVFSVYCIVCGPMKTKFKSARNRQLPIEPEKKDKYLEQAYKELERDAFYIK